MKALYFFCALIASLVLFAVATRADDTGLNSCLQFMTWPQSTQEAYLATVIITRDSSSPTFNHCVLDHRGAARRTVLSACKNDEKIVVAVDRAERRVRNLCAEPRPPRVGDEWDLEDGSDWEELTLPFNTSRDESP